MAINEGVIRKFTDKIHDRMVEHQEELDQAYDSIEGKEKLDVSIQGHFAPGKSGSIQIKGGVSFTTGRVKAPFEFSIDVNQSSMNFGDDDKGEDEL